jgi:hypothetical protein
MLWFTERGETKALNQAVRVVLTNHQDGFIRQADNGKCLGSRL